MDENYYIRRYGDYDEIDLPRNYRVYFDPHCHEFSDKTAKEKLLDLAYVITHGFDIRKAIKEILEDHPYVSEDDIHRAIKMLTAAANHVDYIADRRRNSLDTDIDIFVEDLLRIYRLPLDNSIPHFLVDDFREVSDQTVYRSNGWELVAGNVNKYQMYKDEDFVFYPGDEALLDKYHESNDNHDQIFPMGPCPEPWYGNPMDAKIIILGDMPQYDDFINRCSNIVLSFEPRLMEEVQLMVRRWMSHAGSGMYNMDEFQGDSGISVSDAYNSQTYRHWIKELQSLAYEMNIPDEDLLNQVCVLNANAYYAAGGNDPLAAGLLPSQFYLRILINYLVNNSPLKPIFIIPSTGLHKIWKKVLGYWIENEVMLSGDLIMIDRPNTKLHLSTAMIGKENVKNILKKIK